MNARACRNLLRNLSTSAKPNFSELVHNQSGATMAFTASAFSVVVGVAALGLDGANWYTTKRENQTIADTAALSGVLELSETGSSISTVTQAVRDSAASNGFVHGQQGQVLVNVPPSSGPNAGNNSFVEVIVAEQPPMYLASLVINTTVTIQARSVASVTNFGEHCVLALDQTMDDAVEVSGTADAEIGCGVASNSSSDRAIGIYGNATMNADPAQAYGDIYVQSNATLITSTPPQPRSQRLADPYQNVVLPTADPSCSGGSPQTLSGTQILSPGDFCGGLRINSGADVTFQEGIYVINNGDFKVNGGASVNGAGVTIILTAVDPADTGVVTINGGANITLTAPGPDGLFPLQPGHADYGKYAGILFIQDPAAPSYQGGNLITNLVAGGATMELTGALYFPTREVTYTGGNSFTDSCVQIVARKVTIGGNAFVQNDPSACTAIGVQSIAQTRVRVTE